MTAAATATAAAGKGPVRRLAAAWVLSGTGSGIAGVALSFYIYALTHSAYWLAATLLFTFGIEGLFTPLAGLLADRYDRRKVMIWSNVAATGCWTVLPFVTHDKVLLIAVATVASIADLPFMVASSAAVPNLVSGEESLNWANGLLGAADNTSRLAGPLLGGVLYAVGGTSLAFGLNAGSYVVSALLVASIHNRFSAGDTGQDDVTGALEGFRVLLRDPMLLRLAIVATTAYFSLNIAFVADVPLARHFHVGSFGYGLIDTVFGAGLLAGSVLSRRIRPGTELSWVRRGMLGVVVGWTIIALAPWFVLVLVGSLITAVLVGYETTAESTIFQEGSTDANRGRVMAAVHTSGMIANVLGFAVAGVGVNAFGGQSVYALGAAIAAVGLLVALTTRPRPAAGQAATAADGEPTYAGEPSSAAE